MDTTTNHSIGLDAMMSHEEHEGALPENVEEGKPNYKSFKKKFRKMKMKFDEAMRQSNEFYTLEQKGIKKARQLAIENDQILEMLLDQNNSAQMPLDKRVNIDAPSPALPQLHTITLTSPQIAAYADVPSDIREFYHELMSMHSHSTAVKAAATALPAPKSLAQLLQAVPHISLSHPQAPTDISSLLSPLDSHNSAPGYLTSDQIDDYIESLDIKLGLETALPHIALLSASEPSIPNPSFGNTNSPYNWLRRHVPHIFLQDSEDSSKNPSKPGALRGAGKRASIPAPSKPLADALEIVEEDGQGYDFALGGPVSTKGKRKRDDEDPSGGYHPKTGRVDEQLKVKKPRAKKTKVTAEDGANDAVTPTAPKKRRPRVVKNQTPDGM